jgi:hypothetical protein
MPFPFIGIERDGISTRRTDLADFYHDHRTGARVPFLRRDEIDVLLRSEFVYRSFPEEPYYPRSTFERGEHDSDPTILTEMRNCLDPTPCKIFIPRLLFVYDMECPRNALRRYVDVTIWTQRRSCDPKKLLRKDPRDVLGL